MGMYEDMMAHDMYRSDPMMMREMEMMMRHHPHMMDSDEEDDYPVMSSRGLPRRLLEMIRPSRKGNTSYYRLHMILQTTYYILYTKDYGLHTTDMQGITSSLP